MAYLFTVLYGKIKRLYVYLLFPIELVPYLDRHF